MTQLRLLCRQLPSRGMAQRVVAPLPRPPPGVPTPPSAVAADIYVAADRTKFYKAIGLFCLFQGGAWSLFAGYLFSRVSLEGVTIASIKQDIMSFNRSLATKLESFTPEAIARLVIRPRPVDPVMPVHVEKVEEEEAVLAVAEDEEETSKGSLVFREARHLAIMMRSTLGVMSEEEARNHPKAAVSSKRMVPFVCAVTGIFTLFVGAMIPRRVIRRISLLPNPNSASATNYSSSHNLVRVSTYGSFGIYPRRGVTFDAPLKSIRMASRYQEGSKFMTLLIGRRIFTFYLERFQAEFLLPEYFEQLNSDGPLK